MRSKRPSITGGRSRTPVLKREHSVTFSHTPLLPILKKEESGFIRPPPAFIKCKNKSLTVHMKDISVRGNQHIIIVTAVRNFHLVTDKFSFSNFSASLIRHPG